MCDLRWTRKLAYGRYTHATDVISTRDQLDSTVWARDNLQSSYRAYTDTTSNSNSVRFYTDANGQQQLIDAFAHRVSMIRKPVDAQAEQYLRNGIELMQRERLFYNRYRWSLRLSVDKGARPLLQTWVEDTLGTDPRKLKLARGNWYPILYLRDDTDATMVRLAEPAKILGIARACTHAELAKALR